MVDLGTYIFKYLNTGKNTPEESFTNAYTEEVYGSEHVRIATSCNIRSHMLKVIFT